MQWLRRYLKPYMARPIISKTLTHFISALTIALLWDRFVNKAGLLSIKTHAYTSLGIFFIALAWLNYLRLDGIKLPRLQLVKSDKKKQPTRSYSDIADYVDQEVVSFAELDEDERDICCLCANIICSILFIVFALM